METQAKRKALWSKKSEDTSQAKLTDQQKLWANLNIGDEKQTNKFQKVKSYFYEYFINKFIEWYLIFDAFNHEILEGF